MSILCCENKIPCFIGSIIASVIVGVASAFLQFAGIITVAPVFYWVALGFSATFLAIYLVISGISCKAYNCRNSCANISLVIAGILGSIVSSLLLLAFAPVATSVLGAILVGLLLLFLSLLITGTSCIIKCSYDCEN